MHPDSEKIKIIFYRMIYICFAHLLIQMLKNILQRGFIKMERMTDF
jgi:hypothetical protein